MYSNYCSLTFHHYNVIRNKQCQAGSRRKIFVRFFFDILTASAINWAADVHIFVFSKSIDLFVTINYTIKSEIMKVFVESPYKVRESNARMFRFPGFQN